MNNSLPVFVNETPLVSVMMPVYNTREKMLRRAIESILAQSYKNLELIIADDASEAYIKNIVKSYSDSDDRIVYLRNEKNQGIINNRNIILDAAQGKYMAVLDHDDYSLPDRIQKCVEYMELNQEIGFLYGSYIRKRGFYEKVYNVKPGIVTPIQVLADATIQHNTVFYRMEIVRGTPGIRYREGDDSEVYQQFALRTKIAAIADVLSVHHRYGGNSSLAHYWTTPFYDHAHLDFVAEVFKRPIEEVRVFRAKDASLTERLDYAESLNLDWVEPDLLVYYEVVLANLLYRIVRTPPNFNITDAEYQRYFKSRFFANNNKKRRRKIKFVYQARKLGLKI